MTDNIYRILFLVILCQFVKSSSISYYDCKTISVTGAKVRTEINGLYQKTFECNAYPVYIQQGSSNLIYFKVLEGRWVIGKQEPVNNCEDMVNTVLAYGAGNKLFPHLVENTWYESSVNQYTNNDLTVECNDVYWTMGCTTIEFPMFPSRCYNETNAIEVVAVQVISLPSGKENLCGDLEQRCLGVGMCDLEELQCRKNVSVDDYDFLMAQVNCDGRHYKCHSFTVQPRYHINCDIPSELPCDVLPTVRTGIIVQYRCRRSTTYVGPEVPLTKNPPILKEQTPCSTTTARFTTLMGDVDKNKEDEAILINYVAPAAAVLFSVIIIAVIVITIRRKRKRTRPTVIKSNHVYDNRTYANIPGRGFQKPRPDIKLPKTASHGSTTDTEIAQAVAKMVVDTDPKLKAGQTTDENGVLAVVILDKKGSKTPNDHAPASPHSLGRSTVSHISGSRASDHRPPHDQFGHQSPSRSSRMAAPGSDSIFWNDNSSSTKGTAQSRQGHRPNPLGQLPAVDRISRYNAKYGSHSDR